MDLHSYQQVSEVQTALYLALALLFLQADICKIRTSYMSKRLLCLKILGLMEELTTIAKEIKRFHALEKGNMNNK